MALSLVSLNIEWDKHLDTVIPFLQQRNADIVCIQELLEADIPLLEKTLGASCLFTPSMQLPSARGTMGQGNAIFSKLPRTREVVLPYSGSIGASYVHSEDPETWDKDYELRALTGVEVEKEGSMYRIFTTHFNWTKEGKATSVQQEAMGRMIALLEREKPFVLVGDMNAPRGGAMFSQLAERYTDNIPSHYHTSIDVSLHRAGKIDGERLSHLMVDGLFTTPEYEAKNVELVFGISDHAAIVATIEKNV